MSALLALALLTVATDILNVMRGEIETGSTATPARVNIAADVTIEAGASAMAEAIVTTEVATTIECTETRDEGIHGVDRAPHRVGMEVRPLSSERRLPLAAFSCYVFPVPYASPFSRLRSPLASAPALLPLALPPLALAPRRRAERCLRQRPAAALALLVALALACSV